jgi:hypothetical protein
VDLGWLLDHMRQDLLAIEALSDAGLQPQDAQRVLHLRAHDKAGQSTVRVNLTGEETFWLNDLERDDVYRCAVPWFCQRPYCA